MPLLPADEARRMAEAIDAGLEPRLHLDAQISVEAAEKVADVLAAVAADLEQRSGIAASWPLVRLADVLGAALDRRP
jgi:hypothetical protein